MTDKATTVKSKNTILGTLLTVAATAIATAVAMKYSDKIAAGAKSLADKMVDGTIALPKLPLKTHMNGTGHSPMPDAQELRNRERALEGAG